MHTIQSFKPGKQRGQVFVVLAVSLVVLMGAVGLAVDAGLGYLIKAKLNAAVDAAAVAGARATAQGANRADQRAQAIAAAEKFFDANYPTGYFGSSRTLGNIVVTFDNPNPGSITVDVDAKATIPVSFMGVMGFNLLNISADAQTVRKDLDMAFVIDTSGSVSPVAATVRTQAAAFLDRFNPATDRVSLDHFSNGAVLDVPIRLGTTRGFDRQNMQTIIKGYGFGGNTNSSEGFWHARNQLNLISPSNRSSMRVIVFFSDGSPNTIGSFYKFRVPSECTLAGAITTADGTGVGTPGGLSALDQQDAGAGQKCDQGGGITSHLTAQAFPQWYNAHDVNDREFPFITNTPRPVTSDTSTTGATYVNVNHAAKNVVEAMAAKARSEGIYVFTLGLGPLLKVQSTPQSTPDDTGENLLKCLANTTDAPARCRATGANQPVGVYCYAATANDLEPCFANLAAEVLRITR